MAKQSIVITSLPRSPEDDQRARMIKYTITMGVRVACIGLSIIVPGWWRIIFVLGAVFLPYIAVVLANSVDSRGTKVESPDDVRRMIEALKHDDDGSAGSPHESEQFQ